MFYYECGTCHGLCDPGELENGVCFDCRSESVRRQDRKSCQTIGEINQLIRARYAQQADGQLVMGGIAN